MYTIDTPNAINGQAGLYLVKDDTWSGKAGPDPTIDIVVVHGLKGHCINSWTKDGTYWPRDLLPEKIPHARIMTFQYDAKVVGNQDAHGIPGVATALLGHLVRERDHCPERPIVFAAHSLGGIVTKEALTQARESARGNSLNIYEMTKGIVFFGTPHKGSDSSDGLPGAMSRIASTALLQPQSKLVEALRQDSPELLRRAEDFKKLTEKYAIVTFYEQNIHPITRTMIVDKQSAIIGVVHEDVLMLGGDHSSMCRFVPGDPRFDTVWWHIKRAAEGPAALRRKGRRTLRMEARKGRNSRNGDLIAV